MTSCGRVIVLNGPSRSGKSSIAAAIQEQLDGVWMNLGMDLHIQATPPRFRPGVGLRPQLPEHIVDHPKRVSVQALEDQVPALYAALYESVAAHARLGLNVVVDVYHHDFYTRPLGVLEGCAQRLAGLPVLFVGVQCPVDVIWERRKATWGQDRDQVDEGVRTAVELGQRAARALTYDLELDTSILSVDECVAAIERRLSEGPPGSAFEALARE